MNRLKYYIFSSLLVCISALFISCEKEIEVDLKSAEPRLVIEGLVKIDTLATVRITKTKDFTTDNNYPAVNGAVVTLSDDLGKSEVLKQNSDGLYVSQTIVGEADRTYFLHVEVEGGTYTAKSVMPEFVPIDSIKMYWIPSFGYPFPMITFQDPAGRADYYRCRLFVNGKRNDKADIALRSDDRDGAYFEQIIPFYEQTNNNEKLEKGDVVLVELQCIDKEVHRYFDSLSDIDNSLTNPTTNIKGGALGYFSAYTSDHKQMVADW